MHCKNTEIARSMRAALSRTPVDNAYYALCCLTQQDIEAAIEQFNRTFEKSQTAPKITLVKKNGR